MHVMHINYHSRKLVSTDVQWKHSPETPRSEPPPLCCLSGPDLLSCTGGHCCTVLIKGGLFNFSQSQKNQARQITLYLHTFAEVSKRIFTLHPMIIPWAWKHPPEQQQVSSSVRLCSVPLQLPSPHLSLPHSQSSPVLTKVNQDLRAHWNIIYWDVFDSFLILCILPSSSPAFIMSSILQLSWHRDSR